MPLDIRNGSLTRPTAALPERAPLLCRASFDSRTRVPGTASGIPKNEGGSEPTPAIHRRSSVQGPEPAAAGNARGSQAWPDKERFQKSDCASAQAYAKLSHRHAWQCHLSLDIRGWPDSRRSCQPCVHPITQRPTYVPNCTKEKRSRATED